jgi:uncharacterized protein
MATQTGQIELVRLLIAAGADVNVSDPQGLSALEHARNRGFTDIAALLMRSGAK